jgi:DGQHR domain-containing protein
VKDPYGPALNETVWRLFERAGFETQPSSTNPDEETVFLSASKKRTVDLSASVRGLKVKIIGENKTEQKLTGSFSARVNDFKEIVKAAKAKRGLLVFSKAEVSHENREYADQNSITVWGAKELAYYKELVETIGLEAKYEIIHSFGIRTAEEKTTHTVLALRFTQPFSDSETNLFLFTMNPDALLKTCVIYRRAANENAEAYQRILKRKRMQAVSNFVTRKEALLPPSIIVHFSKNIDWSSLIVPEKDKRGKPIVFTKEDSCEPVALKIPMEYSSLELIDGQHRLYGFVGTDDAIKKDFNLTVLGIHDLSSNIKRDTFIAINDNAHRIDPNLVLFLKYTEDEAACQADAELMALKIVVELNKTSPFKSRIRLLDFDPVGDQIITLKGFAGYYLRGLVGDKGLLRQYYGNTSAEYVKPLRLYFSLLKNLFKNEWKEPERYVIFTNRGISAFLRLLKSILKAEAKPIDQRSVEKYLKALKQNWKGTWETESLSNAYIGSKGWKDFHRDLVAAIRRKHPTFKE